MTMRGRTFRSGLAVMGSSLTVQSLGIVSLIVLARLLEVDDFGVVTLATVLVGTMHLFSGMGLGSAVVASSEEAGKAGYHAWVMTAGSGVVLAGGVLACSEVLGWLLGRAELGPMFRWMAIAVLADALAVVPRALLAKEMMFGRLIVPRASGALGRMGVSIGLAWWGFGMWSLVAGYIAQSLLRLAVLLVICRPWRRVRGYRWEGTVARGLARFGVTTMGTRLLQYAYNNGDDLVVGRVLGTEALGFYSQGYRLSDMPTKNISMAAGGVLFPAYTKIRGDVGRLAKGFLDSFRMVAVVTVPLAVAIAVLAPEAVVVLMGAKWRGSIVILQVFALMSLLRPLSGTTSPVFLALGRPGYNFRTAVIQAVVMAGLIPVLIGWGSAGVAWAVVTAFGVGFAHNVYLVCRRTGVPVRIRDLARQVWAVIVAAAVMTGVVMGLKGPLLAMVGGVHDGWSLAGLVAAGAVSYVGVLAVLQRRLVSEIVALVLRREVAGAATAER